MTILQKPGSITHITEIPDFARPHGISASIQVRLKNGLIMGFLEDDPTQVTIVHEMEWWRPTGEPGCSQVALKDCAKFFADNFTEHEALCNGEWATRASFESFLEVKFHTTDALNLFKLKYSL